MNPKDFPSDVKHGTFFERNVPINSMFVHYRTLPNGYARPLNSRRANKLVAEWDPQAVGILLLSLRNDGLFAVIDGQHRIEAAGRIGIKALDAYVYIDLSLQDEARLYRKFGDYLKQNARDRFIAALAEGHLETVAINRILVTRGLHVQVTGGQVQNGIQAIESVLSIAKQFGPTILRQTIDLIHEAWGSEPRGYVGPSLVGTAHFLGRFQDNPNFNRVRLIERMQRLGVNGVEQQMLNWRAIEKGSGGAAWGKALLAIHDKGVRNELGEWPERVYSEETLAGMRERLMTMAMPAARTAAASSKDRQRERAVQDVRCPVCKVGAGNPCVSTGGAQVAIGQPIKYPHDQRLSAATAARRKARRAAS